MPIWGTGPRRTDGRTNPQINATILYVSSPNLISNLSFWFDANDNTTIDLQRGNSSNIYGWRSKGNFPILISTAATVAPAVPNNAVVPYIVPNGLNGRQTVFFPGISSILMTQSTCRFNAVATNNETTIFTVVNPTNNGTVFAYENYFGNRCSYTLGGFFYGNFLYVTVNSIGGTCNVGYYQQTFYRRNSDSNQVIKFRGRLNNSGANTLLMTANQTFALGGIPGPLSGNTSFPLSNPGNLIGLTGNIAEVLLYNRGLTDDEIVSVEGYLAKKWGIQNQLQFNHVGVARNPPLMGYRLLSYPTLPASNAALWFDTMDTATMSNTVGIAPPNNLDFVANMRDKASGCNAFTVRWPVYDQYAWNYKPTLKYIFLNPNNARLTGTPPPYRGSTLSMFLVLNAGLTPAGLGSNIVTIGEDNGSPSNRGLSIYVRNNSTIGIQRGVNLISSFYQTGSNILVSAFVNGTTSTIGGLPPSTTALYFNGSLVASTPTPSTLSSFNMINYCMGGNNNFQDFQGNISEWSVFYRSLGTSERNAMHRVMLPKWDLPSNQPITYINSIPVQSGLFGWYDAYDQTTVLRNSSNNVSMWLDKSGQNNHMSTNLLTFGSNTRSNIYYSSISVSTNQYPSLFFPSTFAFMQTSTLITNQNLSSMTVIAVKRGIRTATPINNRSVSLFSTFNALEGAGAINGSINNGFYNFNIPNSVLTSNYSTFHINTLLGNVGPTAENGVNSLNAVSYYNGINAQTTTGLSYVGNLYPSYIRLMNGPFNDQSNGDTRTDSGFLGEVLLYNRILNSNELSNTHMYLLNKWGISTILSNVPVTSGLNLWLDCYDPTAITTDTNCNVLLWRDKSLFRRNFSNFTNNIGAPTYVTQGGNSLPSVRFDNTFNTNAGQGLINSNFFISSISSISIFMVKQVIQSATTSFPQSFSMHSTIGYSNGNNEFFIYEDPNGNATTLRRANQNYFNSVNIRNLSLASYTINSSNGALNDIPASNYGLVFNGVKVGTPVDGLTPSTFNTTIGLLGTNATNTFNNNTAYNGFINEVLYYNRALTFVERQQVESYLLSKWNI